MKLGYLATMRSGDRPPEETGEVPTIGAGGPIGTAPSSNSTAGSVIVGRVGTVGSVQLASEPVWATDNTIIVTPRAGVDGNWIAYVLRSADVTRMAFGTGTAQPLITASQLKDLACSPLTLPDQRRIADFLDDRVGRIDRIIAGRRVQITMIAETVSRQAYEAVAGINEVGPKRVSGLDWLGEIPRDWATLTVSTEFLVELGKMLDERRQTGAHAIPYLRNRNVQWDRIEFDDLKVMDIEESEYGRFTLEPGDLLVCEGGQPGRAAVYEGELRPLGFQKALHRARSRGRSRVEWLRECLRVAVELNVFAATSGQTTIGHLTNEQFRSQRFPFPPAVVQERLIRQLDEERRAANESARALERSIELLTEYKSSVITAAVTGELDVTTADSGIPG